MAQTRIEEIEGIQETAEKLRIAGITSTEMLLEAAQTPAQRSALAESTGISVEQVLKFANMADLFRIHGVGKEYAELLEAAGVDTVPELAQRNAENLTKKMVEVNEASQLTRRTPSPAEVEKWIAEAKTLPRRIEY